MADYDVTGVTFSYEPTRHITMICGTGPEGAWKRTPDQVAQKLRAKQDRYFVRLPGQPVTELHPHQSPNGNWFVSTSPDKTKANNLELLPECPT